MKWILRMAWRETRGRPQWILVFIMCVGAGVGARVAIGSFVTSTRHTLASETAKFRDLLGADAEVRVPRLVTAAQASTWTHAFTRVHTRRIVELLTMASHTVTKDTRLVRLYAVDGVVPYYGRRWTNRELVTPFSSDLLQQQPWALVYPELLTQLQAKVGDALKIGTKTFQIAGVLLQEPGADLALVAPGPLVMIGMNQLEATGLVQPGSRLQTRVQFGFDASQDVPTLTKQLKDLVQERDARVVTARESQTQNLQILSQLSDLLMLVALLAFIVGGVGIASAVRAFIEERMDAIAVMRCVGATSGQIAWVFLIQTVLLGLAGAGLSVMAVLMADGMFGSPSMNAMQGMGWMLNKELPTTGADFSTVLMGLGLGVITTFAASVFPLLSIRHVMPVRLLRGHTRAVGRLSWDRWTWLSAVGLIVALYLVSGWETSWAWAGWLTAGTIGAGVVLWLGVGAVMRAGRLPFGPWTARLGWLNVARGGAGVSVGLAALGFGIAFIGIVSMVRSSLVGELTAIKEQNTGLFVIDIQPDQREPLAGWLAEQQVAGATFAPLIRARLLSVNGVPNVDQTSGEGSGEDWARRREWNLSWREALGPDERVVAGTYMSPTTRDIEVPQGHPTGKIVEASVEQGFAKRLGLNVGDVFEVDIQGVKVAARVTSLRKVRWTSFRPNFFVLLSRSALERAPATWVGSLPRLDARAQGALPSRLMERFPNLTIIDISRTMDRVMEIVNRVLKAVRFISVFSLIAGLAVVLGIIISGTGERAKHIVLWRLLGASNGEMSGLLAVEFACLAVVAAVMGLALAAGASHWLVGQWFDLTWRPDWRELGLMTGGVTVLTVVAGWLTTSDLLLRSPAVLLRGES